MKKRVLLFVALLSVSKLLAIDYTNKTFLMPRSISTLNYIERTGFHRLLLEQGNEKEKSGGTLEAIGFYRESNNDAEIGRYFGTNHKNTVWIGNGTNVDRSLPSNESILPTATFQDVDIDSHSFFHHYDYVEVPSTLDSQITLKPKQTILGANLVYRHDFDNLFLKISVPFAEVKNNLCTSVSETKDDELDKGILDYLSGQMDFSTTDSKLSPLTHLKVDGNAHNRSTIGDVTISIGHRFSEKEDYHCQGSFNLIVPAGNKAKSEYLFEPIVGNGGHLGIGLDFESTLNLQRNSDSSLELTTKLNWTYLFEETEKRTLGFHNSIITSQSLYSIEVTSGEPSLYELSNVTLPWNYYRIAGQQGIQGIFPLANILTQNVEVAPDSSFDGSLNLAYHTKNITLDFGYSCYTRSAEKVSLKQTWTNDTYALASVSYCPEDAFEIIQGYHDSTTSALITDLYPYVYGSSGKMGQW
jgi:hypothetical protein